MEYKKVEVFVPNDSQPHLCRITTNDYQTQIEWLSPIEDSDQDELWDDLTMDLENMRQRCKPSLDQIKKYYLLFKR